MSIPLSYGEKLTRNQAGNTLLTILSVAVIAAAVVVAAVLIVRKIRNKVR